MLGSARRASSQPSHRRRWLIGAATALLLGSCWAVLHDQPYQARPAPQSADGIRAARAAVALQDLVDAVAEQDPGRLTSPAAAAIVANARALDVHDFELRYIDALGGVAADGSWTAYVDARWRFGPDPAPAQAEIAVALVNLADGGVAITGFGGHDRRSPLWLAGPVQVRRSAGVLVLATDRADRYHHLARTAVRQTARVLGRTGPLVVEVPGDTAGLEASLAAASGRYAAIAAVTASVDGSTEPDSPVHVFVNPDVLDDLREVGAQVVMTHEAVHVATDASRASQPLWLVEGFADYVALRDVELPISVTAGQILQQLRRDGVPDHLPTAADFDTTTSHLGATYESAWLACQVLADAGGEQALLRFYRSIGPERGWRGELRRVFGLDAAELTRRWRAHLAELAA